MADRSIVLRCSNCGSPQYEWSAGRPAGAIPDFGKLQTHPCHVCGEAVNWALFANGEYRALLAEDCLGRMTAEQNLDLLLTRAVAEGVDPRPVPICPSASWTAALNLKIERTMGASKSRIVVPVGVTHRIVVPVVVAPGWSKALQRLPGALAAAVLVLSIVSRMDWSESQRPRPATTKSSGTNIPWGEGEPTYGAEEPNDSAGRPVTKPCEVADARYTRVAGFRVGPRRMGGPRGRRGLVTGNAVRLRVAPDISSEVRAVLYRDDEVTILHRERYESSWLPVCCILNGKRVGGWVHADYLR